MTDTKPSLTEFLLARLQEEEAVAKAATPGPWSLDEDGCCIYAPGAGLLVQVSLGDGNGGDEDAVHIARHDPARVLADVEAKRRIIGRHSRTPRDHWSGAGNCEGCGFYGEFDTPYVTYSEECPELMDLALPYAGHDDYREEWAL